MDRRMLAGWDKLMDGGDPRSLWQRYLLALTVVAALILGAQTAMRHNLADGRSDVELIEMSTLQQMLSQRILYLAGQWREHRDAGTYASLQYAIELFTQAHGLLREKARSTEATDRYFHHPETGLDRKIFDFLEAAADVTREPGLPGGEIAYAKLRRLGHSSLLADLEEAAELFQITAAERQIRLIQIQNISLLVAMLVLALEASLIFIPAQRSVTRSIDRLEAANAALREKSDALRSTSERLEYNAHHDPLTDLANRKMLCEALSASLTRGDLAGRNVCAMHVDLDRFKAVNDRMGHATGDKVLRRVAKIMRSLTRPGDVAARVGGDEFVILAEFRGEDSISIASAMAANIIAAIEEPMLIDGTEVQIGASIGIAFAHDGCVDGSSLVADSDIALYEAKRAGRGQFRVFDDRMRALMEFRNDLARDLEVALDRGEVLPHFQPIVETASGRLIALELLVRWHHPLHGVLVPSQFIPIAEETGLLEAIDARIAIEGMAEIARLRAIVAQLHESPPDIAINVSSRSLRFGEYAERLEEAARAHALEPANVRIEVLEAAVIDTADHASARTIAALSSAGFEVYVDNFGTGLGSLASLSRLTVAGLKIDRSLVADLRNPKSRQVVSAIIELARVLSLSVVAEGVETRRQIDTLHMLGATALQGNAISPPLSSTEIATWLRQEGRNPVVQV